MNMVLFKYDLAFSLIVMIWVENFWGFGSIQLDTFHFTIFYLENIKLIAVLKINSEDSIIVPSNITNRLFRSRFY